MRNVLKSRLTAGILILTVVCLVLGKIFLIAVVDELKKTKHL